MAQLEQFYDFVMGSPGLETAMIGIANKMKGWFKKGFLTNPVG
jgi:hypothetical protein